MLPLLTVCVHCHDSNVSSLSISSDSWGPLDSEVAFKQNQLVDHHQRRGGGVDHESKTVTQVLCFKSVITDLADIDSGDIICLKIACFCFLIVPSPL